MKTNSSYRWVILVINFFICVLAYAGLTTWYMAAPSLAETFKISSVQASLGGSMLMLGYAVGSFVEASISPKVGHRNAGLLGLILMIISVFCIPLANSYGLVLVLRFFQGWGILWLVAINSSMAWFPLQQRGLAAGVIGGGLTVGIGSGGLIADILMKMAGTWQGAFNYFAIILLIFTIIWAIFMRNPPKDLYPMEASEKAVASMGSKINPFKTIAAWLCALCLFFNCWQLIGFNSILPGYMMTLGYTGAQIGLAVLLTGLIGVVATPVGGIISDSLVKKGWAPVKARSWVMAVPGFLVAAVTVILFPFLAPVSFAVLLITCIMVGWGVPVTNATLGALPMDLLGDADAAGKMFGLTIFAGIGAGGVLAPLVSTSVANTLGWTGGFIVLGLGALAGALIGLMLPRFQLGKSA